MAVPVVLVAGFLGAGKTSLVNHLLAEAGGRRIAAIVNDFGAINIDAALVGADADGVVGLGNGCICCTLQGDLLRTIGMLLRRVPAPDGIVIETSGVADPGPIVASLMDPVIWRAAPLETVVGVVDAADVLETPARLGEALYRAQLAAADFVVLNKLDLMPEGAVAGVVAALRKAGMTGRAMEAAFGRVPAGVVWGEDLRGAPPSPIPSRERGRGEIRASLLAAERYEAVSWVGDGAVALGAFQAVMEGWAPVLVRAKGVLEVAGRPVVFQMVGRRAALAAGPAPGPGEARCRLVIIHEIGALEAGTVRRALDACLVRGD